LEGSSTLVTIIVPSPPCALWNFKRDSKGKSQITSEFKTKNGSSSFAKISLARARGPAR